MKRRIAFFDFDGTITYRDTLLELIRFHAGNFSFYFGFILYAPLIVAMKLKLLSNQTAKEKVIGYFFGRMPLEKFDILCEAFAREALPSLVRNKASHEIRILQEKGAQVVVVSASPENWVKRWCDSTGVVCISSRLEISNDRLTGKLLGKNCHGDEKVSRIKEKFNLADYDEILCYGDTKGDYPMLQLGTIQFFKPFR
ncbi:MAG TPA: HAD-IB family hydrolase [Flavitalea sp.]|nr:HAD-IB family hydrolase [Flavitalea sp.]